MAVRSEADEPFHGMDVDVARIIRPKAKLRLREHDVAGKAERLGGAHGLPIPLNAEVRRISNSASIAVRDAERL